MRQPEVLGKKRTCPDVDEGMRAPAADDPCRFPESGPGPEPSAEPGDQDWILFAQQGYWGGGPSHFLVAEVEAEVESSTSGIIYYLLSTIYLVAELKYRAKDGRQTRFQSSNMPHIILLGTLDTKRTEVLFLYRQLQHNAARSSTPLEITLIDCGRQDTTDEAITFGHADLLSKYAASHSPAMAGGCMSCDTSRLEATLKRGIPNIISIGATDTVNFGQMESVPRQYHDRKLHAHNPNVTCMRTSAAECRSVGRFILDRIGRFAQTPEMVEVWLPRGGTSSIGTAGVVFADAEADAALADTLQSGLESMKVRVFSDGRDLNDKGFAIAIADRLMALVAQHSADIALR
ncbi:UPF0261-domain-containing protein [Aspergillus brunneoviolaceus CBS 621.78]|uniref:UPF0261-domain-containing protein n=1 Tax=Aspergillus brunneoviolaceus CBS 621.78 TaxID=1450534 RepID=A0ACD1GKX7_9EURO|nr:UPF0261-domain-containing protein [Aspergillus brunneoviolaceus CBS 621.78]RAH49944.1 UPF0261-domain-containing protein [Aspergillus brunneoviolaceus CBS 621.78]